MYLPLKIALRYFFSRKNQNHFGFLTGLSVLGIFISVAGFLVVDGILSGFGSSIQQTLIGFDSNLVIKVNSDDEVDKIANIVSSEPDVLFFQHALEFESLVYNNGKLLGAIKIRGIPDHTFQNQPNVKFYTSEENSDAISDFFFLGEDFFSRSLIPPGSNTKLLVLNPFGDVGPSGEFVPVSADWSVSGFFNTGHYDFDAQYAYVPLSAAKSICGLNCHSNILVYYKNNLFLTRLEKRLKSEGYAFSTWRELNKSRYTALRLERLGLFFLLTLVLMIASVNIFSLISLISFKKLKENVLFWVLGLSKTKVRLVYIYYSLLLGLTGAIPGLLVSLMCLLYLRANPLPLPPAYYLEALPVDISVYKYIGLLVLAPLLSVLTGLWPAVKTTQSLPLEVLRDT